MKFQVIWNKTAELELADLWLAASDRRAVSQAASAIEDLLRHSADSAGESREGNRRVLHEDPLAVTYECSVEDCSVYVMRDWRTTQ